MDKMVGISAFIGDTALFGIDLSDHCFKGRGKIHPSFNRNYHACRGHAFYPGMAELFDRIAKKNLTYKGKANIVSVPLLFVISKFPPILSILRLIFCKPFPNWRIVWRSMPLPLS